MQSDNVICLPPPSPGEDGAMSQVLEKMSEQSLAFKVLPKVGEQVGNTYVRTYVPMNIITDNCTMYVRMYMDRFTYYKVVTCFIYVHMYMFVREGK